MTNPEMGIPAVLQLNELFSRKEPRKNPRTRFKQESMESLTASVRAKGVSQPILVRPREEGGYEIVAGERRVRASRAAFGDHWTIPAYIRNCTDDEADELALVENTEREPMSPADEAEAAYKILLRENGNHEAAARSLAWSVSTLKRRLALMRLTPEVRAALIDERIELGHAELLAAVDPSKQNGALAKIIEHRLTVAQVKDQLGAMSHQLSAAIFDKGECATCDYNSSQQRALFGETVDDGRCTRPPCYAAKTESHLQGVAASLGDDVPKVVILRDDSAVLPIKLSADGPVGVGDEQLKSCRSCASFGCTVSATLGSLGEVERDLCFDAECNSTKVANHIAAKRAEAKSAAKRSAPEAKATARGATKAQPKPLPGKVPAKRAPRTDTSVKAPQAVKVYRLGQWRQITARVVFDSEDVALRLLVAIGLSGQGRHIDSTKVGDALAELSGNGKEGSWLQLRDAAAAVRDTPAAVLQRVTHAMAASAMNDIDESNLRGVMSFLGIDMGAHWTINADFLGLLTKSEIEGVADEVGLAAAMGEKAFKKAMAGKKDEGIKALLSVEGFAYQGALPKVMLYHDGGASAAFTDGADEEHGTQGGGEDATAPETASQEA